MEHHVIITCTTDKPCFAGPIIETDYSVRQDFFGEPQVTSVMDSPHAFDTAVEQAEIWAESTGVDHQVWHVKGGIVTEYMEVSA